ncbi:uracil-DNA glycosylase [Microbacterium sp. NPDC089180]|uniref:uracil-DNA glycosylase n=1 Tax=unclassified Microbacterium TaxID=2609290 RepID=UPI00343F1905
MPRRMADPAFRTQQWDERYAPHIAPVNRYVDELRGVGRGFVPYVAPLHGGVNAQLLSILRDPGPATRDGIGSGFVCVENDDGSAELQAQLLETVSLSPTDLLPWNAYPWYINRAPKASELDAGVPTVLKLIDLAPNLKVVLLQGSHAAHAWERLVRLDPTIEADRGLTIVRSFHPSPQALFVKDLEERERRRARRKAAFEEVAEHLR